MSPSELNDSCHLGRNYINYSLRVLSVTGLVRCFSPSRTGRIYGLTTKGRMLRGQLLKTVDGGRTPSKYHCPRDLDWNLYSWVVAGRERRKYLRYIHEAIQQHSDSFKASHIFLKYRYGGIKSTPRTEVYRALWQFEKKGILRRIPEGKRGVRFKLTKKGLLIVTLLTN